MAVSDDGKPVMNAELMRRALHYAQHFGIPVIQHAEDLNLTGGGVMHEGEWSTRLGLPGIPGAAEDVMVARDIILAEDTGGRYHVAHLSTARSLELVRRAKARRACGVTCEVDAAPPDPHRRGGGEERLLDQHQDEAAAALGEATARRCSTASPTARSTASPPTTRRTTPTRRTCSSASRPFGIVGLETTLSLCLDRLVRPGILSLPRLVELLSTGPARVLGVDGREPEGGEPRGRDRLPPRRGGHPEQGRDSAARGRNTPFDGWTLHGHPVATFLDGRRTLA